MVLVCKVYCRYSALSALILVDIVILFFPICECINILFLMADGIIILYLYFEVFKDHKTFECSNGVLIALRDATL